MTIKKHPFYEGKIALVTGKNAKVIIQEEDLLNPPAVLTFAENLSAGVLFVSKVCEAATTAINASTGIQNTYLISLDRNTGKVVVSVVTGSAPWRVVTTSGSESIFSGDSNDSFSTPYEDGQRGTQGLGFTFGARGLVGATTALTSEHQASCVWCPSWPSSNDGRDALQATTVEAVNIYGTSDVYTFSEFLFDKDISKSEDYFGGFWSTRTQTFEMISREEMDQFYFHFWGECAMYGALFAYFDEYDDATPRPYGLTGDSLIKNQLGERPFGVRLFNHTLTMRPKQKPETWASLWGGE